MINECRNCLDVNYCVKVALRGSGEECRRFVFDL